MKRVVVFISLIMLAIPRPLLAAGWLNINSESVNNALPSDFSSLITDTSILKHQILSLAEKIQKSNPRYNSGGIISDSLIAYNDRLTTQIETAAQVLPDFMERDFESWAKTGLKVITADNRKLKIICWNDQLSGTNQEWIALAVWKTTEGLKSRELDDKQYLNIRPSYNSITAINQKNGHTYYLVQARGHEDNSIKYDYVKAYQIGNNGLLNDHIAPFKTPARQLNYIGYEINLFTSDKQIHTGEVYPLIHVSKDKQHLFIPVIQNNGTIVPGKYLNYAFNGNEFIFQKGS